LLAVGIGTGEAAEVRAFAGAGTGDEKCHVGCLLGLLGIRNRPERNDRCGGEDGQLDFALHGIFLRSTMQVYQGMNPLPSGTYYRHAGPVG
jgi:hypothetical protein